MPAGSSAGGDIAEVATRLATAFPRLVRRVTDIAMDEPIVVRVACEGVHEGMWGSVCPTKTKVVFEEQHQIVVGDGRVVSDQVVLDVSAIELQLCGNVGVDPDETVRMGKARREWYKRAKRMSP
jgi:predicted ester cyclase